MLLVSRKTRITIIREILREANCQATYSNGLGCCIVEHPVTVFGALTCNGTGVSGDIGISSSGPDTSGRDFTRSFKKSNRLSDKIHCFLQIYKL